MKTFWVLLVLLLLFPLSVWAGDPLRPARPLYDGQGGFGRQPMTPPPVDDQLYRSPVVPFRPQTPPPWERPSYYPPLNDPLPPAPQRRGLFDDE